MEFFVALVVLVIAWWLWRSRKFDKLTTIDFDSWLEKYDSAATPLIRSGMAVAFLAQSVDFAWKMGAINSKQRDTISTILKKQGATTTMVMWCGSALPVVLRVLGKQEVSNTPARAIGMLMLLAWITPETEREDALRKFLSQR